MVWNVQFSHCFSQVSTSLSVPCLSSSWYGTSMHLCNDVGAWNVSNITSSSVSCFHFIILSPLPYFHFIHGTRWKLIHYLVCYLSVPSSYLAKHINMLLKEAELRVDDLTTAVVHVSYTTSSEVKVHIKCNYGTFDSHLMTFFLAKMRKVRSFLLSAFFLGEITK